MYVQVNLYRDGDPDAVPIGSQIHSVDCSTPQRHKFWRTFEQGDVAVSGYTITFDTSPAPFRVGQQVKAKKTGVLGRVLAIDLKGPNPIAVAYGDEDRLYRFDPDALEVVDGTK